MRPKKINKIKVAALNAAAWFKQEQGLGLGVNSEWVTEEALVERMAKSIREASDNTQGKTRDTRRRMFRLCGGGFSFAGGDVEVGILETDAEYKHAVAQEVESERRRL